jgi:hypothetical protein
MSPSDPSPPFFFLWRLSAPRSASSAAGAVQLPRPPLCRPLPPHLLPASFSTCRARALHRPLLLALEPPSQRHAPRRPPPTATSPLPCPARVPSLLPSPFFSAAPAAHTRSVSISFPLPCAPRTPDHHRHPLLPSGEPLDAVDSCHRSPIAPTDPLASFLNPCSCSPTPKRHRISAGAPLPATATRRRPLLAVEHPFLTLLNSN